LRPEKVPLGRVRFPLCPAPHNHPVAIIDSPPTAGSPLRGGKRSDFRSAIQKIRNQNDRTLRRCGKAKTDKEVPVTRSTHATEVAVEVIGIDVVPRTAPQYAIQSGAVNIIRAVVKIRQAPFPYIPCHIDHTKGTITLPFILLHRGSMITLARIDRIITSFAIPLITPRIYPAVIALSSILPLILGRQHDLFAGQVTQPQAVGYRFVPGHSNNGMFCSIPFRIRPVAWVNPGLARFNN